MILFFVPYNYVNYMKRDAIISIYKKVLIDVIEKLDIHKLGRKKKFKIEFYLDYIFRIFFYGDLWETFVCELCDRSTIRKMFYKWKFMQIVDVAYSVMIHKYRKTRKTKNLFVDSTIIENVNCSGLVDYYYKIKTKKQVKVSVLCDENKVSVSYVITKPSIADCKLVPKLTSNIQIRMYDKFNVIGDKGYITKRTRRKCSNKEYKIITSFRKNQWKKNTKEEIKLLSKRFVIEQSFSQLKRTYRRLKLIYDRDISNYTTFLKMAFTCQVIRYLF